MGTRIQKQDLLYPELSYEIVGSLFAVHNELGGEQLERVYQKAIAQELIKKKIPFQEQFEVVVIYKNEKVGQYYLDFLIADKIVLEIKKDKRFSPNDIRQTLAYLKSADLKLGILANFTKQAVQFKRIVNLK